MEPQTEAHPKTSILIVEDDSEIRLALVDVLEDMKYDVDAEADAAGALRRLDQTDYHIILTDVRMPGMDGIELCRRLNGDVPHVPVVIMTAFGDVETAVDALRAGAFDFVTKPIDVGELRHVLARACSHGRRCPTIVALTPPSVPERALDGLIGSSQAMSAVREQIVRAAATESTVLITGESGTGKELAARAVHDASARREGPFVPVSCAAVPLDILESELFGFEKGAFTGALDAREGLLTQATGGTLFLDEIGDMPLELQPKLLRALQERSLRPIGSGRERSFDARIVAATNKNLQRAMNLGQFRQDLYFRINVIQIALPPLRERGEDVLELARWFLATDPSSDFELTATAEKLLLTYHFPGNVRELQNCMAAAMALASGGRIDFEELPSAIRNLTTSAPTQISSTSLAEVERRHIEVVLRALGWNKADAARTLGIDRATLYRKLKRLGLSREHY